MKIKIKNNPNLTTLNIQDKSKVESLYITGNNSSLDVWNIFEGIKNTPGNQLIGNPIRLGTINKQNGTWKELQDIKSTFRGLDIDGIEQQNPVLIGTWHLKGMHEGEYDLNAMKSIFGGSLDIVADKNLITFSDSTVESIVNLNWGFEYDYDESGNPIKGVDYYTISEISSIGQNFKGNTSIETFDEFQYFTGIRTLDGGSFQGCTDLSNIILPEGIQTIGGNAFEDCTSLHTLQFPSTVITIGTNQTSGWNPEYIRITSENPPNILQDSFPGNFTIYIGDGSSPYKDRQTLNRYLQNSIWSQYYKDRLDLWYNKIYKDKIAELSNDYEKLDFIESDATNIINTEFTFNNNTRFVADISFLTDSEAVYGSSESGLKGIPNSTLTFIINTNTNVSNLTTTLDTETLYDIDIKNGSISKNGSSVYSYGGMTSSGGTITLFGDSDTKYVGRTWMTRIYENDILIHDFVPVYNKNSNSDSYRAAGLYDCADGIEANKRFYGFTTYSGSDFGTRLLTENNEYLITDDSEFIEISNNNTTEVKVSSMNEMNNTSGYYTIIYNENQGDKKYSINSFKETSDNLNSSINLPEFSINSSYTAGDYVSYDNYCYRFIRSHKGQWNENDVYKTTLFDSLLGPDNSYKLTVQLRSNDPIYLDSVKSDGTMWSEIPLIINNSQDYRIEMKFMYDTFVANGYFFGDTNTDCYMTRLRLGESDNGSGVCSMAGYQFDLPEGVLTQNIEHTLTLTYNSLSLDGTTYSPTEPETLNNNTRSLGLFSNFGCYNNSNTIYNGTAQTIGMTLYYFKIYKNDVLIYDCRPAIMNGKIGVTVGTYLSANGSGSFLVPNNFTHPFSNCTVLLKDPNSDSIYSKASTDNTGFCSFYVQRNKAPFDIDVLAPQGWDFTREVVKESFKSSEYCYSYLTKIKESCNITINISINDESYIPTSLNNTSIYAISDIAGGYIEPGLVSVGSSELSSVSTSITFPIDQRISLVFPSISGYTKPDNITILTDSSSKTINAVYTIVTS